MESIALSRARRALHAVAELVLAGPQFRRSGTIRLRVAPGGFATTREPALAVVGGEVVAGDRRLAIDGHSCADLAAATGVDVGPPADLYRDGSGADPDEKLDLDPGAAAHLAAAFAVGDEALRRFAPAEVPVLWPEHFDVGISVDEVNYGVSPGDGYLDEPYAYVGPWQPRRGPFWNAPFGAARPMAVLTDVESVHGFFVEGRRHAFA